MTDIQKIELLGDDVHPEFPSLPGRNGYVEDTVDDWLSKHLAEVNEIIKYQNHCVDVAEGLEAELIQEKARIAELEANPIVAETDVAQIDALNSQLAAAKARIRELENSTIPEFPTLESETVQASVLLQHATKLGQEYIEQAKADGEQIRKDAESKLVELRTEIEELEAHRFATYRSLEGFFSEELLKLRSNPVFASGSLAPEAEEAVSDEVSVEEDAAGDQDVTPVEADVQIEGDPVAKAESEGAPALEEDDEVTLEPGAIVEDDEESVEDSEDKTQ